ncbi:hypothetical protein [Inquilinus sp. CA228]|uniref:hypothetical protein n=1 Tax=Inquilinus sp. CA228 TaxID=3455609 RepID=UPI003F8D1F53
MAAIGHVGALPWLKRVNASMSDQDRQIRKTKWACRIKNVSVVLGIIVFAAACWLPLSYGYEQAGSPDRLSKDQLMARECSLTAQQVISLVEEQLSQSSTDGSLWSIAQDRLVQSLTGCRTNPGEVITVAMRSKYFSYQRSSDKVRNLFVTIMFSKTERPDDFNIVFNVCTEILNGIPIKCGKDQIVGVSVFHDIHRWP